MQTTDTTNVRLKQAFRIIVILMVALLFLAGTQLRRWLQDRRQETADLAIFNPSSVSGNMVKEWYPDIDFQPMYPALSPEEIDQVQRETFDIRFVYAPYVQFRGMPVKKRFVETSRWGYRKNAGQLHPWPPDDASYDVFVFGGSTTFGSGLPDSETVVAHLERELSARITNQTVRCYNFGSGYYFSTQERILFHDLLLNGTMPKLAIFIDGLNDFRQVEGFPQFTGPLHETMAPDIPFTGYRSFGSDAERGEAVDRVLHRYSKNILLIATAAHQFGIRTVFIGQPVPFGSYPITPTTYPFKQPNNDHQLCAFGYTRFAEFAAAGSFGPDFIWAADAFREAVKPMYADAIHYSPLGSRRLAQLIVSRIFTPVVEDTNPAKP